MGSQKLQLPTINFKGLDPNQPHGSNWETARTEVLTALQSYGCFGAVYEGVRPEVTETLFQSIMPEMFALPLEVKQLINPNSYLGYRQYPGYESIAVGDASNPESVEGFVRKLWPEGNQKLR